MTSIVCVCVCVCVCVFASRQEGARKYVREYPPRGAPVPWDAYDMRGGSDVTSVCMEGVKGRYIYRVTYLVWG
eukprot:COSAG01_NODE_16437_length_1236_cov_3.994723_1_plen_73_part_00